MGERAVVIGAGPVGCVLALTLQRHGYEVEVYEKRPDMRASGEGAGRSINLVLTRRGLTALRLLGLEEEVLSITVPVYGRALHARTGELTRTPYGKDEFERNHSISRAELNAMLQEKAGQAGVALHFDCGLDRLDLEARSLHFDDPTRPAVQADLVFGADGAPSAVRKSLVAAGVATESMELLTVSYKELLFPAAPGGGFALDERSLHIWPRGAHFLMGLPNLDGSFTGTIYLPNEGPISFASIDTADKATAFFEEHYPHAIQFLGPNLAERFMENPVGGLGTVRCYPWGYEDRILLVGDSAHAVVPFFGQGLNCGFEDCAVLDRLLGEHSDRGQVFKLYEKERKPAADAIADMAVENFVEMGDKVRDPRFLLAKRVEQRIEAELWEHYRSRYSMVVYSSIPYHLAQQAGEIQRQILAELCEGIQAPEEADLGRARELIDAKLAPFLQREGINIKF
jgi:kynurenine 3-monooxygenase